MEQAKVAIDLLIQVLEWQIAPGFSMKIILAGVMLLWLSMALWRYASEKLGY